MRFLLPGAVGLLIAALERAGFPAYAVGGCVRDLLMARQPHDYDICTAATPEQMRESLPGIRLIATGEAHGTLTAVIEGKPYEITTFRFDGAYADHRRPDRVLYVTDLLQDLARRDFTINAMAYHPERGLCDPFGGREDIGRRLVRCVGEPRRRFDEDALRILRALRFASACDFGIEPDTAAATLAMRDTLRFVARERIFVELGKLLCGVSPARGMAGFAAVWLAAVPELAVLAGDDRAWERAVRRVCSVPTEPVMRWTALFWGCPESASTALRGLRCDNATRQRVEALLGARALPMAGRAELLGALRLLGREAALQLALLRRDFSQNAEDAGVPAALEALLAESPCYRLADLAVNGADLLAAGFEGREIGLALEALLGAVIDGRVVNGRDELLAAARATALRGED